MKREKFLNYVSAEVSFDMITNKDGFYLVETDGELGRYVCVQTISGGIGVGCKNDITHGCYDCIEDAENARDERWGNILWEDPFCYGVDTNILDNKLNKIGYVYCSLRIGLAIVDKKLSSELAKYFLEYLDEYNYMEDTVEDNIEDIKNRIASNYGIISDREEIKGVVLKERELTREEYSRYGNLWENMLGLGSSRKCL